MNLQRSDLKNRIESATRIVIKIGSARVSGSESKIQDFLFDLTSDIRELKSQKKDVIIVSSGAIAQGKKIREERSGVLETKVSLPEKQAFAAMGQNRLLNLYEGFFSRANLAIGQILFGKRDLSEESGIQNLKNTFDQLLAWNVIPVVNENDSVSTEEINLGDNDVLSALVSALTGADLLIILTGVDGLLVNGTCKSFISEVTPEIEKEAKGPSGPGTGGMITKLKSAKLLLHFGIPTAILNGESSHSINRLMSGEEIGTLICGSKEKENNLSLKEIASHFFPEFASTKENHSIG